MKKTIITLLLLTTITCAKAQYSEEYGDRKPSHKASKQREINEFETAEMSQTNKWIKFSGLPALPKPTWAIVTNAEGEFIKESKITPDDNEMDLHRLQNGMYFVTLVYRNKSKKAFVLHVGAE